MPSHGASCAPLGTSTGRALGSPARSRVPALAPLAATAIALALTLPRVCRTVSILGDSAVMTAAAVTWGVPQPPGYPLFTLFGHLFSLVPILHVAWRVHVMSAVLHAITAGVVAHTVARATRSWPAGFTAGLFLAFTRRFFFGSLYAEVFPLNDLLTSVVFALAFAVERRRTAGTDPFPLLAWFTLASALASAHHQMIVLAAPALAALVGPTAWRELRARPRRVAVLATLFAIVVSSAYALVLAAAARAPVASWGDVHDLRSLARLFLREDYGGLASAALTTESGHAIDRVVLFATSTWRAFGAVGIALAGVGVVAAWRESRRCAVAVILGVLACGPVFAAMNAIPTADAYGVAFLERFFTMADVALSLFVGFGVALVERFASARTPYAIALPALGMVWLVPLLTHVAECDLRDDRRGEALVHDLMRPVPEGAVVLIAGDDLVGAATYACAVLRSCEDRAVFSPGQLHLPWRAQQLARRHPSVVFASREDRAPRASEIVTNNLATHPVFVSASLLDLDPTLRALSVGYLPQGLLLRVVDEDAIPRVKEAFLDESRAMLTGEACAGCMGGSARAASACAGPALDDHALALDATALENHARVLRFVLGEPGAAAPLESRAASLEQCGGASE